MLHRWSTPGSIPRCAMAVLILASIESSSLNAQSLSAVGVKNLNFGDVLPGVPVNVLATDAVRAGQFDITGPPSAPIEITFTLPEALTTLGGASMPISFGDMSAGFSPSGSIASQDLFNPLAAKRVTLSELGRGSGFVGGALNPPTTQPSGSYSAPVTITIANVGL
jgi:hypothetical protein